MLGHRLYGPGLNAAPFPNDGIVAPPRPNDPIAAPHTGARVTGAQQYYWTIAQFCEQGLLPFLFAEDEDERQLYTIVVLSVTDRIRECARDSTTSDRVVRIEATTVRTFRALVDAIEPKLIPEDPCDQPDPRGSRTAGAGRSPRLP